MKFKTWILLLACTFFMVSSMAQNKVERFCKISFDFRVKHGINITEVTIDYGISNDTAMINKLEKVKNFDNDIQALNFLTSLGWQMSAIIPHRTFNLNDYACLFKKDFIE